VLVVTSVMMAGFSARMVPAIALITGSVEPRRRGGFMSVNSSVQQMSAGLAAMAAGQIVGGSAATGITHFGTVGWVAAACTVVAVPLALRLRAPARAASPGAPTISIEPAEPRPERRRATGT
jgi:MFS family permease